MKAKVETKKIQVSIKKTKISIVRETKIFIIRELKYLFQLILKN